MKSIALFTVLSLFWALCVYSQDTTSATFTVSSENAAPYNKAGSAVVAAKMNVLYAGVENPIDISVPGVSVKDITVSINGGGKIEKKSDGHFVATMSLTGVYLVSVKVKGKEVSRHEFRVKRIPDPQISLNGKLRGGYVQSGTLATMSGIVPLVMDFDFPARFTVTSFSLAVNSAGKLEVLKAQGPLITPEMKALISRTKPGDIVVFDDVRVVGPDNQPRIIDNMSFIIIL
ncbi:MAG TPA: GldM family protein [Chitinophagales bacterium]|nr:GldM family protein [Chitinophagales bacterium]